MLTTKEKIMAIFEEHIDKETLRSILATKEKINELPVNSLQFIKIIVELEEALSIEIDNDRLSMDTFCSFEDFFYI